MPHNTTDGTTSGPPSTSPHLDQLPPPNSRRPMVGRTSETSTGSNMPQRRRRGFSHGRPEPRMHPQRTLTTEEGYYRDINVPEHSRSTYFVGRRRSPPRIRYATSSVRRGDLERPPTPAVSRSHDQNRRILPPGGNSDRHRDRYIRRRRLSVESNRGDMQSGDTPRSGSCLILVMPEGTPVHLASANNIPGARLWLARRVGTGRFQTIRSVP